MIQNTEAPTLLEVLLLAEATIERLNRHDSANGTLDVLRVAITSMREPHDRFAFDTKDLEKRLLQELG